jgi:predicted  nucleic acid-binding Zn-ribbon protein
LEAEIAMHEGLNEFETIVAKNLMVQNLKIAGSDRVPRMDLSVSEDGQASIAMMDLHKRVRIMLAVGADGVIVISVHDTSETPRVSLYYDPEIGPEVAIRGPDGMPVAKLKTS